VPLEHLSVLHVLVGFRPTLVILRAPLVLQEHSLMVKEHAKHALKVPILQIKLALVILAVLVTVQLPLMMVVLHVPRVPFQQLVYVKIVPQEHSPTPLDQPLANLVDVVYKST